MKTVRIATIGCPSDYSNGLLPIAIKSLGFKIDWVQPKHADLVIYGPFFKLDSKKLKWCPKPLRAQAQSLAALFPDTAQQALKLFHTAENVRHDTIPADYSISFDLNISSPKHFRLPYWMEMIDWAHEGLSGNENPRFGSLMKIERLMQPLGRQFLGRKQEAAFLSTHIREPRKTLFDAVQKLMPVHGFGAHFNKNIQNHHLSGFYKQELLQEFGFNLCPENSMYPGYYTEKIPEAFFSECLPISWTDENVKVDFNPKAFINLAPMSWSNFAALEEIIQSPRALNDYADQSLLLQAPSILPFRTFVAKILEDASS